MHTIDTRDVREALDLLGAILLTALAGVAVSRHLKPCDTPVGFLVVAVGDRQQATAT